MRGSLGFIMASLLLGCGWSAADGPWNDPTTDDESPVATAQGVVCAPDGVRGVPGLTVSWHDSLEEEVLRETTDPWGEYEAADVDPGRYTVEVGDRVFTGLGIANLAAGESTLPPLCLDRSRPQALVLRTELASATDLISDRLEGLGLEHVHDGPDDAGEAGQLLGSPAGLVDYGVLAVAGRLDFDELAAEPGALDGLLEFLGRGGGLYLSGEAWPLLDLLAPGRVAPSEVTTSGFVEADVVDMTLAEQLQWDRVGVRLHPDAVLFAPPEADVDVLLRGVVTDTDGQTYEAPLLLRTEVNGGTVLLSSFLAPGPRSGDWWMGDPSAQLLPDGSWDGRGAALDRLILQL